MPRVLSVHGQGLLSRSIGRRWNFVVPRGRPGIPVEIRQYFFDVQDQNEFVKVVNGGSFVEWDCGADLSADTIEAGWQVVGNTASQKTA